MMITWNIAYEAMRECDNVQINNQGTKEIKFRNFLSTILYIYIYIYPMQLYICTYIYIRMYVLLRIKRIV